jgi:hypothetical protein
MYVKGFLFIFLDIFSREGVGMRGKNRRGPFGPGWKHQPELKGEALVLVGATNRD